MMQDSLVAKATLAGAGAALCIGILSGLSAIDRAGVLLMAPFGATMVLLFALPQSPLAQPRNIVFGHVLTTLIGLVMVSVFTVTPVTLGLAVGLAVAAMMLTKTVHPPAGANPLVIMLGGLSWDFLLAPVIPGVVIIVLTGALYHRLTAEQAYPQKWF